MRFILSYLMFFCVSADNTQKSVQEFIRKLDGNSQERKLASKELKNLPAEFYPILKKYLKQKENVSIEVTLRLTKAKMVPLRAKWLKYKRINWYKEIIVESYEKHGAKNPKWDKLVKVVHEIALKQFKQDWFISSQSDSLMKACQAAVRKGCQDPLVLYFLARSSRKKLQNTNPWQLKHLHMNAYEKLVKSKYSPYCTRATCS